MSVASAHAASVGVDGVVVFACEAVPGSDCRLLCAAGCIDTHAADCDGATADSGSCNVLVDLEAVAPADTYIGDIAAGQWRSGLIEAEWSDDTEGYQWLFAAEACGQQD